jgi:hypothetical protein
LLSFIPSAASTGFVATAISSRTLRYWVIGVTVVFAWIGWLYGGNFKVGASLQRRRRAFLACFIPGLLLTIAAAYLITWTNPSATGGFVVIGSVSVMSVSGSLAGACRRT